MKTKIISTAVIAAFSMALAVNAAEEKKKGGGFASLDKNNDGSVDKAEYMASPAAQKDTGKASTRTATASSRRKSSRPARRRRTEFFPL